MDDGTHEHHKMELQILDEEEVEQVIIEVLEEQDEVV
jgi:hypothetical protein